MDNNKPIAYRVYPAIVSPIILTIGFAYLGVSNDSWFFASIPFSILGTVCAAPNLNLANGCLVVVSCLVGFILSIWFNMLGMAILIGSVAGWIIGAIEKRIRMKPEK